MIDCYVNLVSVSVSCCRTKTATMHGMTYVYEKRKRKTLGQRGTKIAAAKTARYARKFVVKISVSQNCDSSFHQKRQKNQDAACSFLVELKKKRNLVCYVTKYLNIRNWECFPKICTNDCCYDIVPLHLRRWLFLDCVLWIICKSQRTRGSALCTAYDLFIDFKVLIRDCYFFGLLLFLLLLLLLPYLVFVGFVRINLSLAVACLPYTKSLNFKKQIEIEKFQCVSVRFWKSVCLLSYSGKVKCVSF